MQSEIHESKSSCRTPLNGWLSWTKFLTSKKTVVQQADTGTNSGSKQKRRGNDN